MFRRLAPLLALSLLAAVPARAQTLSGPALVKALQQGGYVILMRHAASPLAPPDKATADPGNARLERQLDDKGKASARAMGAALKSLHISVGRVLSSPTFRALQTCRLLGLPKPETDAELGDGGKSMQAQGAGAGSWLRIHVGEPPLPQTDTVIITHMPNIKAAYEKQSAGLADGEAMVFQPDGEGGAEMVGRIRIEDWPALAAAKP